ncbi:MAG: hypothetical protein RJA10_3837 [Pseudomonadota bacterium]|jgi:hypothetical protein
MARLRRWSATVNSPTCRLGIGRPAGFGPHTKTQGRRSHVDADDSFKQHGTQAWPTLAPPPAVNHTPDPVRDRLRRSIGPDRAEKRPSSKAEGQAYRELIAARPGSEAAVLRLHLVTGVRARHCDAHDHKPQKRSVLDVPSREPQPMQPSPTAG